jgi:ABC-type dipeptide/oligopeptide/nickel transport system ATPase subunit
MNRPTNPALRFGGVWARHPGATGHALQDLSFSLASGSALAVVGESGAGKSTLVAVVAGFLPVEQGTVDVEGVALSGEPGAVRSARRRLGLVHQLPRPSLDPTQAVLDAVAEPLVHLAGVSRSEASRRAASLLSSLGIGEELHGRRPAALSGGQCQRVATARAMIHEPPVLLADEATASLDPGTGELLLAELARHSRERGQAVLWVTHRLDEAERLSGGLLVLLSGLAAERMEAFQTWDNVLHPYSRYLAAARRVPVPPFAAASSGCPFRPGCPLAVETCADRVPEEREIHPGHHVRCFRA